MMNIEAAYLMSKITSNYTMKINLDIKIENFLIESIHSFLARFVDPVKTLIIKRSSWLYRSFGTRACFLNLIIRFAFILTNKGGTFNSHSFFVLFALALIPAHCLILFTAIDVGLTSKDPSCSLYS